MNERILDLHYRVPYNTYIKIEGYGTHLLKSIDGNTVTTDRGINYPLRLIKVYLRPMSSMTDEEKEELKKLINEKLNRNIGQEDDEWTPWVLYDTTGIKNFIGGERFYFDEMIFIYDWLNKHHFDYRGLIEKGLALEAPKDMYNG